MTNVLIAGESWITQSTHIKGMDSFTTHSYVEGVGPLRDALTAAGHNVTYLPGHLVPTQFPETAEALSEFDVIILSDIGANSIQLSPSVFEKFQTGVDRLGVLADWVAAGGGFMMIGGYLSFTGFEAKAAFRQTRIAEVLPVEMLAEDDRAEFPGGVIARVDNAGHEVLAGISGQWPALLGYNRTVARPEAEVLATVGEDPLVAVGTHGAGRTAVFTSDCSPHWAPPAFCEEWAGYGTLFGNLVEWLGRARA
ncbi:glutamine amidotransferase [Mycetocola spongiae]|uniref:glutamine amidotransferase n=1 Tax=Mycetocola spongiae TaxID=2859226 RepID=UPI001CF0D660|nr:glutamine amidotransferase [Mycetocola spongiae]UCR89179.1 glutamine amidotransferase [Mycetocola spongiae]